MISLAFDTVTASITTHKSGVANCIMFISKPPVVQLSAKDKVSPVLILLYARKHIDKTPHCIDTAAKFLIKEIPAERA